MGGGGEGQGKRVLIRRKIKASQMDLNKTKCKQKFKSHWII